jgi:phosphatidylinositol glycan class M
MNWRLGELKDSAYRSMMRDAKLLFPLTLAVGLLLRLGLVLYGAYHDAHAPNVPFTDIDYHILEDGASAMLHPLDELGLHLGDINGTEAWEPYFPGFLSRRSPFARSTYRYSPLLAVCLLPNVLFGWAAWGKCLFVAVDLLAGLLLIKLTRESGSNSAPSSSPPSLRCASSMVHPITTNFLALTAFWVLNPLVWTISSRGNAESIVCALIILFVYGLARDRRDLAALSFGLAVHVKIFPLLYVWPLFWWMKRTSTQRPFLGLIPPAFVRFSVISGSTFLSLAGLFYAL